MPERENLFQAWHSDSLNPFLHRTFCIGLLAVTAVGGKAWEADCGPYSPLGPARESKPSPAVDSTCPQNIEVRFGVMGSRFAMVYSVLYPVFIAP